MSERENTPLQAVWDSMGLTVDLSSLVTDAQHVGIAHALSSAIGDVPDGFYGTKRNPCPVGEALYTFYWVSGGSFGKGEVAQPAEGHSGQLAISCWIRPLTGIRKVDVGFDVTNSHRMGRSDYAVKQKITAHWDDETVDLDATGIMDTYARPALEKLIELVLASIRGKPLIDHADNQP
jgi:hypothetical protein